MGSKKDKIGASHRQVLARREGCLLEKQTAERSVTGSRVPPLRWPAPAE